MKNNKKNNQISQKRKSQITIYLMLGVVLFILLGLFFILSNSNELKAFISGGRHPVTYYVEECLRFNIINATELLSSQGGFIYEFTPNLTTTKRQFAYSIYPENIGNRIKNTAPKKDFMEREFARYIEENIDECIDQMERYVFEKGIPKAFVTIYPESILVKLEYSLKFFHAEKEYEFKDFSVRHSIPLGRMVVLRDKVLDDLIAYPNLMILDKLYETDFEMFISPYSGEIKIIEMVNKSHRLRNDPLTFTFAIKDIHELPPPLRFTQKINDQTIKVGQRTILKATCSNRCKYYDDTILFEIDEETGFIDFTPSRLDVGQYKITITIDDDIYKVSDSFILTIEE